MPSTYLLPSIFQTALACSRTYIFLLYPTPRSSARSVRFYPHKSVNSDFPEILYSPDLNSSPCPHLPTTYLSIILIIGDSSANNKTKAADTEQFLLLRIGCHLAFVYPYILTITAPHALPVHAAVSSRRCTPDLLRPGRHLQCG